MISVAGRIVFAVGMGIESVGPGEPPAGDRQDPDAHP
jgi:hypothetical protein